MPGIRIEATSRAVRAYCNQNSIEERTKIFWAALRGLLISVVLLLVVGFVAVVVIVIALVIVAVAFAVAVVVASRLLLLLPPGRRRRRHSRWRLSTFSLMCPPVASVVSRYLDFALRRRSQRSLDSKGIYLDGLRLNSIHPYPSLHVAALGRALSCLCWFCCCCCF